MNYYAMYNCEIFRHMQEAHINMIDEPVSLCFSASHCYKILPFSKSLKKEKDRRWEFYWIKNKKWQQLLLKEVHDSVGGWGWPQLPCTQLQAFSPTAYVYTGFPFRFAVLLAGRCWHAEGHLTQHSLSCPTWPCSSSLMQRTGAAQTQPLTASKHTLPVQDIPLHSPCLQKWLFL